MTNLSERVALVTGSARGIGRAIAERYASLGASIVVNYSSDEKRAAETVAGIERMGVPAIAVKADVSEVADLDRLFSEARERFGQLDIVVANAGIELIETPTLDITEADFDRLYAINAKGAFFTLQLAAKHVADNGRIIYIGTSNTRYPLPGYALYGSSKIGAQFVVEVLTDWLTPSTGATSMPSSRSATRMGSSTRASWSWRAAAPIAVTTVCGASGRTSSPSPPT